MNGRKEAVEERGWGGKAERGREGEGREKVRATMGCISCARAGQCQYGATGTFYALCGFIAPEGNPKEVVEEGREEGEGEEGEGFWGVPALAEKRAELTWALEGCCKKQLGGVSEGMSESERSGFDKSGVAPQHSHLRW